MKKIKISCLFLICLSITNLLYAQEEDEGTFEVTSERTDFGIDKINLNLILNNNDLNQPLQNAIITVTDTLGNELLRETGVKAQKTLTLDINQKYNINIVEKGFEDTTFVLDAINERTINQSVFIGLSPVKIVAEFEITDFDTENPLEVEVILTNKNRDEVIRVNLAGDQSQFTVKLYAEDDYEMAVRKEDYFFYYDEIKSKGEDLSKEVKMVSLKIGNKIALNGTTFAKGKADLNEQSKKELDRVVELMNDNPTLKLEIAGHTDDIGSSQDNLILSQNRVNNVRAYLLQKDVNSGRISGKGYGEEQPIVPNDSEDNRAKNRRFELIVTDI